MGLTLNSNNYSLKNLLFMSIWPMRRAQIFSLQVFFQIFFLHSVYIIFIMAEDSPPTSKSPRMDHNMMGHPVFGDYLEEKLPDVRLPTFLQVLNRVRFLKRNANRGDSLRSIYNIVAEEVSLIWKEAFVVPVLNNLALAQKMQTEIEQKLKHIQSTWKRIVDHPEKITVQTSEMKKVFSITKCKCFLKTEFR